MAKSKLRMHKFGELLMTRERAREIASTISRGTSKLELDFEGVKVASPSFLDETLRQAFELGIQEVLFTKAERPIRNNLEKLTHASRRHADESSSGKTPYPKVGAGA